MRNALGKGLSALIPEQEQQNQDPAVITEAPSHLIVAIEKISANRFQPRKNFDDARLAELAESIKEHGLAQPIIVSKNDHDSGFELIAGERRLRACELAGLKEVEVIVRKANSDKQRLAISLVENIQREDLNAVEEALGYLRLMKEFNINQTELTKVVGKSKSAISNTLRLLELPDNIQNAINDGSITEGHARALLMADSDDKRQLLLKNIIEYFHILELTNMIINAGNDINQNITENINIGRYSESFAISILIFTDTYAATIILTINPVTYINKYPILYTIPFF